MTASPQARWSGCEAWIRSHLRSGCMAITIVGLTWRISRTTLRMTSWLASKKPSRSPRKWTVFTPTLAAACFCSSWRSLAVSSGSRSSKPPASPSVMMQYWTSAPAAVSAAMVPAAPKSRSSGWAPKARTRWEPVPMNRVVSIMPCDVGSLRLPAAGSWPSRQRCPGRQFQRLERRHPC